MLTKSWHPPGWDIIIKDVKENETIIHPPTTIVSDIFHAFHFVL